MNPRAVIFPILVFLSLCVSAQTSGFRWWNPATASFPVVEGQAWPGEVAKTYDRLPARAEKTVRSEVWNLSRHSAGLMIRFFSNSPDIRVRYTTGPNLQMPHMPATGVSGVDMYAIDAEGKELWCHGKYSFGDTISYVFDGLRPNDSFHKRGREYRLYLPLYNSVEWLEIGTPDTTIFTPLALRPDKPIVIYGTSIAQGGCASRPGMAWTAILSRNMDRPLINLGFSGNGRLEPEIIEMIAEIDAKVFVLDCLPNMVPSRFSDEELRNRIIVSVHTLQQKRPGVPILLTEHAGYTEEALVLSRREAYQAANASLRKAFSQLKSEGIKNIFLLTKEELGLSMDGTVDGTHPTDLGMLEHARGYEKSLRMILHEPVGNFSTTRPVTQYREPDNYDWQSRHREILRLNRENPPRIVYMGNSITHFWGGNPVGPRRNGADSWDKYLEPLGVRNFGYGWDRVENVLWRIYHGELDGYETQQVVIHIGTNNLHLNSDEEILAGMELLVNAVKIRQPKAEILLLGTYPRRNDENRISTFNLALAQQAGKLSVHFADPGKVFLKDNGKLDESLFYDGLHPNKEGYRKLAEKLTPYLKH
ncbi:MAG: SGNH/GDSL hydrolase family protein [Bacteroidia bacterium]|nr:SGNH/GDSL hydrolase family protein [Bacteroidia bacterium]